MAETRKRIALVTHVLDGGVWSMTRFLHAVLQASGRYEPELIVLATSRRDRASVRLSDREVGFTRRRLSWNRITVMPVNMPEHGSAKLKSSAINTARLTRLLRQFDLVQMVSGSRPTRSLRIQPRHRSASLRDVGAAGSLSLMQQSQGLRKQWLRLMTALTGRIEHAALQRRITSLR